MTTSNPRLLAQDVAQHYLKSLNPYKPHSKNVQRRLHRSVLAVTKRILRPQDHNNNNNTNNSNNDDVNDDEEDDGIDQNENDNQESGIPEEPRRRDSRKVEGLDWMDYLDTSGLSEDSDLDSSSSQLYEDATGSCSGLKPFDTNDDDVSELNVRGRLSVRSMARMNAFLGSCALILPNDPILPAVAGSNSAINKISTKPLLLSNLQNKLGSVSLWKRKNTPTPTTTTTNPYQNDPSTSSLTTALSPPTTPKRNPKPTSSNPNRHLYPQINPATLTTILELYIRTLRRTLTHTSECVLPHEPRRNLLSRIHTLLSSLVSTAGTVGSVRTTLTRLLGYFTRELLAVEYLSEELEGMVRRIVLEYEHRTSFASLAFLSSPGEGVEAHLSPLVVGYVEYLREEWEGVVEGCKLEGVLVGAMDGTMRHVFKTVSFRSIGHLLEVCREQQNYLENIVIRPMGMEFEMKSLAVPLVTSKSSNNDKTTVSSTSAILYSFEFQNDDAIVNTKAVKQALRDLRREVITVNGHILPPVNSLKELVNLLRETLNSRPLKLRDSTIVGVSGGGRKSRSRRSRYGSGVGIGGASVSSMSSASSASPTNTSKTFGNASSSSSSKGKSTNSRSTIKCNNNNNNTSDGNDDSLSEPTGLTDDSDTDFLSSGNEGDTDGSRSRIKVGGAPLPDAEQPVVRTSKRRHFNVEAIDIMTRRLLIAASRTGTGGDAYFVVRDLFGGEDVEVVTSEQTIPYGQMPRRISDCTIELIVRLSSIVIKCHSKFDVFPKQLVKECEPLIQLCTTSTEVIQLHEVRANEPSSGCDSDDDDDSEGKDGGGDDVPTVLVLREKKTRTTGQRIVSIRPAMYELVDNLKTPS